MDATCTTRQKGRKNMRELAQAMLTLAREGKSGVEIMAALDITAQQAKRIHYQLIEDGKIEPRTLRFPPARRILATERGICIPRALIEALGLASLFPAGIPVTTFASRNALVIIPDWSRWSGFSSSTRLMPLALGSDSLTDDVIVMGESDEPIA